MQNNQKVLMLGGGTSNSMLLRLMASSTLVPVDDVTLSEFAVNDVEASLALSFTTNEYRTANTSTTFADAFTGTSPKLTYSTAAGSNSTMTQGYGPELVTNGGFDTDTGWTLGAGWTISDGQLTASSATGFVYQIVSLTGGKSYHITASNTANIQVRIIGGTGQNIGYFSGANVDKIFTFTSGAGTRLEIVANGTTSGTIDNVSVREAPKIVWAPHNLVDYSEDFSQWGAGQGTLTNTNVSTPVAPDGSITADEFTSSSAYGSVQRIVTNLRVGASYTFSAWVQKGTATNEWSIYDASNGVVLDTTTSASNGAWEKLQGTFTADNTLKILRLQDRTGVASTGTVYLWGAHVYRSDLGGMHPVPGAVGDFQYYVPTNGSAEYLPRVGHHVYNGTTWVNEGLLIESEPRTNLVTHSEKVSLWSTALGVDRSQVNQTAAPSGEVVADLVAEVGGSSQVHMIADTVSFTAGVTYTQSVFLKKGSGATAPDIMQLTFGSAAFGHSLYANYNIATGEVLTSTGGTALIEDFGNGWYRCAFTSTASTTTSTVSGVIFTNNNDALGRVPAYTGVATSDVFVYGLQVDQGQVVNGTPVDAPTPSSYMPTSGGTYTRTAQSLTVPAHWYDVDNPTYTGPELVTNGGFSNGTTGWAGNNATLSLSSGRLRVTDNGSSAYAYQVLTVEPGKTYKLTFDYLFPSANTATDYEVNIRNTNQSGSILKGLNAGTTAWVEDVLSSNSMTFTPTTSTVGLTLASSSTTGDYADFDNISVRQVSAPQFGWPEPEYIGPDLVTDGSHSSLGSDWSYANGVYTASGAQTASQNIVRFDGIGIEEGKVYSVSCDIANLTAGNAAVKLNGGDTAFFTTNGTHTATLVGLNLNGFQLLEQNGFDGDVSNISVREINPLAVSIQMDGRVTYADDTSATQVSFSRWLNSSTNSYLQNRLDTTVGSDTGRFYSIQYYAPTTSTDLVGTGASYYSPGVLVPFNISSRHGSTFIRGATDGVLTNLDTTPTALPDLSSTNLAIAQDFMGTIGTFRQFAGDIGDTGLVTATNPSTEPTLSLTFDGTGGSYYNLSWSE